MCTISISHRMFFVILMLFNLSIVDAVSFQGATAAGGRRRNSTATGSLRPLHTAWNHLFDTMNRTSASEPIVTKQVIVESSIPNQTTITTKQASPVPKQQRQCGQIMPYDDIKSSMRSNSIIDRLLAGPIVSHTWPWMAFMKIVRTKPNGNLSTTVCGASVIGKRFIMSASHCIRHHDYRNYSIFVGTNSLATSRDQQNLTVYRVTNHPMWDKPTMSYDCAIIETNEDIKFNHAVQPICLTNDDSIRPPTAIVAGWGRLGNNSLTGLSPVLREVALPFVNITYCKQIFHRYGVFFQINTKYSICAGAKGLGTCHGDSGSPLMMQKADKRWYQIGIDSFVKWCPDVYPYFPGVFSRVAEFCVFIGNATRHQVECT